MQTPDAVLCQRVGLRGVPGWAHLVGVAILVSPQVLQWAARSAQRHPGRCQECVRVLQHGTRDTAGGVRADAHRHLVFAAVGQVVLRGVHPGNGGGVFRVRTGGAIHLVHLHVALPDQHDVVQHREPPAGDPPRQGVPGDQ